MVKILSLYFSFFHTIIFVSWAELIILMCNEDKLQADQSQRPLIMIQPHRTAQQTPYMHNSYITS